MITMLLGAPGSGKGTQAKLLAAKYGFKHLATGDIFRREITDKTALGLKAQEYVKSGKLVPDELVTRMVSGCLDLKGGRTLLDGFPRTLGQATALGEFLGSHKTSVGLVLYLDLTAAEVLKRLCSRRVCLKCGEAYNTITRPPKAEGRCDACKGEVIQRVDDNEATIGERLKTFNDLTKPLIAYYKKKKVFQQVDASKAPTDVMAALTTVIDKALRRT